MATRRDRNSRLGRRNLDELQIWEYIISAQHVKNQIANLEEIAEQLAVSFIQRIQICENHEMIHMRRTNFM